MQQLRVEVEVSRPQETASLLVDMHPCDERGVRERFAQSSKLEVLRKIDVTDVAVVELDTQAMATEPLDGDDPHETFVVLHHALSLEGSDPKRRQALSESLPVLLELVSMERSPLGEEADDARGQSASKERAGIYRDSRDRATVLGVEVGRKMIVRLHLDHDAEEPGDLRHLLPLHSRHGIGRSGDERPSAW